MGPSTLIPTRRSGSGIGGPGPSLSQALAWGVLPRSPPARHPRRFRWALHAPEPVSSSGERENIERQARNSPFVGSRWGFEPVFSGFGYSNQFSSQSSFSRYTSDRRATRSAAPTAQSCDRHGLENGRAGRRSFGGGAARNPNLGALSPPPVLGERGAPEEFLIR